MSSGGGWQSRFRSLGIRFSHNVPTSQVGREIEV
jgi:hypothetical protein